MIILSRGIKFVLVILVMCMFVLPAGFLHAPDELSLSFNVSGDSITDRLSDGSTELTIPFGPSGGSDTGTKLSLPKRSVVSSASFELSGENDGLGSYPTNVKVDVGDDGDLDWEFNLSGAGSLGKQTEFVGGLQNKMYRLNTGGFDSGMYIRLPKTATVSSAKLDVVGNHHGVPNGDFSTNTIDKWTTVTNQYSDTVTVSSARGGNNPPVSWGASGSYLMLRSNPFNSNDVDCNLRVESDTFPRFNTNYITMDWDLVEHDNFNLWIRIYDENNNFVTAKSFGGDNNNDHADTQTGQVINIQALSGQNLEVVLRLWDGDAIDLFYNDWGRVAVDNIIISDSGGNPLPDYPKDAGVDVGNDGAKEFSAASLVGIQPVTGLAAALNSLLVNPSPSCQLTIDEYGNEYLDIPVNVSVLSSPGLINLTNMEILYDWDASVEKSPKGDLADELNSLIPASGSGNITIPVSITSATGGKIQVHDIKINYNAVPVSGSIPVLEIDEDSLNPKFIDLEDHFNDDSPASSLSFDVAQNSAPGQLEAYIEAYHYLTLNANREQDWFGNVSIVIRATDSRGLFVDSAPVTVRVLGVNDEPRPNILLDKFTLIEDGDGLSVALDKIPYFVDPEDDELYYHAETILDEDTNLSILITDDNVLEIVPGKNWNGYGVPIWLYCDDDEDVDSDIASPHQVFSLDVTPVNDPPEFSDIGIVYLKEDQGLDNWRHYSGIVSDVETASDMLEFSIIENDNSGNIQISVDNDGYLDIALPTSDYVGTARVKFRVVDEDEAVVERSFKFQIEPENDGPRLLVLPGKHQMLEDTVDSTTLNIFDIFYDPDSPNLYTITGDQHVSVTINDGNGTVTLKPERNWYGSEIVTLTATDTYLELDLSQKTNSINVNITVAPVNDPPKKPVILSPREPRADPGDQSVTFVSEDGVDVDSDDLKYYWDFDNRIDTDGDGEPANDRDAVGKMVVHKYPGSGYYYATLVLNDGELNSSEPEGVYVKVTTDYDKVSDDILERSGLSTKQLIYLIPFIILLIVLIILIIVFRRKIKIEEKEREKKKLEMDRSDSAGIPRIIDGELLSESRPGNAHTRALPGEEVSALPPGAGSGITPNNSAQPPEGQGNPDAKSQPTQQGETAQEGSYTPAPPPSPAQPASPDKRHHS